TSTAVWRTALRTNGIGRSLGVVEGVSATPDAVPGISRAGAVAAGVSGAGARAIDGASADPAADDVTPDGRGTAEGDCFPWSRRASACSTAESGARKSRTSLLM